MQRGLLLFATAVTLASTTTVTDEVSVQPMLPVAVTVYIPVAATVALLMLGFCNVELKPFGPDHEYETPPLAERLRILLRQTGLLLVAFAVGLRFTATTVLSDLVHPFESVTKTIYVPAFTESTLLMIGFCCDDEKPFGPVHK